MQNPPEDKEQSLEEHLAELRIRVIRILIALAISASITFFYSNDMIKSFWKTIVNIDEIYVYSPLEWIVTRLIFSLLISLIVLYPYIIYEFYLFAKPGLYEKERIFLKRLLISSYFVFLIGFFTSYEFLVPFLYRIAYSNVAYPYFSAGRTIQNALRILIIFGLSFQIPLAMLIAERLKLVDYNTFKNFRIPVYLIVLFLVMNTVSDITFITQISIFLLFVAMYELGLFLLRIMAKLP